MYTTALMRSMQRSRQKALRKMNAKKQQGLPARVTPEDRIAFEGASDEHIIAARDRRGLGS